MAKRLAGVAAGRISPQDHRIRRFAAAAFCRAIMAIKVVCSPTTACPDVLCGLAVMNRQKEA
jgi:hypothetical protein